MKCSNCKIKVDKDKLIISGIKYFCSNTCYIDYANGFNKTGKVIKQISSKNKNIAAKFSKETKAAIMLRDRHCVLCSKGITDIHHVYFGTQCEYGSNRNDIDQGVSLCRDCHNEVHGCKQGEGLRQKSIDYLLTIYKGQRKNI